MEETVRTRAVPAGSGTERDRLLDEHLNLVYHIARRMSRTGGDVEYEELVSAGVMGLIDAIEKFDCGRGLAFSTFAVPRIRGAILDEIRRLDTVSRVMRQRQRRLEHARHKLTATMGRTPVESEIANEIGVDTETLWRWRAQSEHTQRVSLDAPGTEDETGMSSMGEVLIDARAHSPDDEAYRAELSRALQDEIAKLNEKERTVLGLYYFEELKLREIAEVLDLTVSRISQIRSQAIEKLRSSDSILNGLTDEHSL